MGLKEDIGARIAQAASHGKQCKLGALIESLPPEDQESMRYAITVVRDARFRQQTTGPLISDELFSIAWLVGVLKNNGHDIGKTAVSEHVRKVCICDHRD